MGNTLEYLNIEIEKEKYKYEQMKYDIAFRLVDSRFVVFNKPKQVNKTLDKLDQNYQQVLNDVDRTIMSDGFVDIRKKFIAIREKMVELEMLRRNIRLLEVEKREIKSSNTATQKSNQTIMTGKTFQKIHAAILSSGYSDDDKLSMETELINLYSS